MGDRKMRDKEGKDMGQRQNYDGPDWKRDALFAECNRRGLLAALKTDAELRQTLIADDEEHLPKEGIGGHG